jgi:hypothetical protein
MFTQSCTKNINCGDTNDMIYTYNVADSNKAQIPYNGTDTLVFVSDKGDTATLYGQAINQFYYKITQNYGTADCQKNYTYKYQNINTSFLGNNLKLYSVSFIAYMNEQLTNPSTNSIKIIINDSLFGKSNFEYFNSLTYPDDSVIINGKYQIGYNFNNSIFFNFKYGILRIKDSKSNIWTKIK